MKPTVRWLSDIGMDELQIAKVISTFLPLLGYSLEQNIKPTVQALRDQGLTQTQITSMLVSFPQLLSYSSKRLMHRMIILSAQGRLSRSFSSAMAMTDAKFAARFQYNESCGAHVY